MIAISCPWCEDDVPMDPDTLRAVGGGWTCTGCLTRVELVDTADDVLALAA